MPTYAYRCTSCGHDFETVQAITDVALTSCPECGGALRKVFHPVGVAFKGSGFYRTDSRPSAEPAAKNDDTSGTKKPAETSANESSGDKQGAKQSSGSNDGSAGSSKSSSSSSSGSSAKPASSAPST